MTSEQWDRTVTLYMDGPSDRTIGLAKMRRRGTAPWVPGGVLGTDWHIGVVARNTSLFFAGDVVIVQIQNGGGERQLVFGRSGRGYPVTAFFMQLARSASGHRLLDNRTPLRIVETPGRLTGLLPTDPAIRRFVVDTLCAGDSGKLVRADTEPCSVAAENRGAAL